MKKFTYLALASALLLSVGACGVGKGKAPPPVASPVITKG
jgi:hypothetical protein